MKICLQPRDNLARKFLCSRLELHFLARTSNVSWEGRENGRALRAIKLILFLEIPQAMQAKRKEREGLSDASLDGKREAANYSSLIFVSGKARLTLPGLFHL